MSRYPVDKLEECFHSDYDMSQIAKLKEELKPKLGEAVNNFYINNQLSLIARLHYLNNFIFLKIVNRDEMLEIIHNHGTQQQRDIVADMISIYE
jgi:predicted house-cleaning noncanonical NTP pyrophosphatase (MazG superfamily)